MKLWFYIKNVVSIQYGEGGSYVEYELDFKWDVNVEWKEFYFAVVSCYRLTAVNCWA